MKDPINFVVIFAILLGAVFGIVVWRPRDIASVDLLHSLLPPGSTSLTILSGKRWMRNVAANPNADADAFGEEIKRAISQLRDFGHQVLELPLATINGRVSSVHATSA